MSEDYWSWLEAFDPDIVYSYVELRDDAVLEIHERLVPADYTFHGHEKEARLDVSGFKPQYRFSPLSSLSTVFRLARHSPVASDPRIRVIDSWHTENPTRFLSDNLGTYRISSGTGAYPNDARPHADLLTIVDEEKFENPRHVPRDLDRVSNESLALMEFAAKRATGVALLSSMFASRIDIVDRRWSGAFNLVIGETFEDRLLFWNARLLVPDWHDSHLCGFRVTLEQLRDREFASLLVQIINSRNHVNDGSSSQPQLRVRTASHSVDELREALAILQTSGIWSAIEPVEVIPGGAAIPSNEAIRRTLDRAPFADGPSRGPGWKRFQWDLPISRPPAIEPDHLADAPHRQAFTQGLWAQDFAFEYAHHKPRLSEINSWVIPKRWRMAGAFDVQFSERDAAYQLPPSCRRSRYGNLAIFAGVNRTIESIAVPSAEEAFRQALCRDTATWRVELGDPPWPMQKVKWLRPSSEAAYLAGVLGMTRGLENAKRLLLHPFLQELFASLGGAPNLADTDIRATADSLAKRARGRPVFDLESDDDRAALSTLIVNAAKSVKAPKSHVALHDLQARWKAHREAYWRKNPARSTPSPADRVAWEASQQRAIDDCLVEMRKHRMLFQGCAWTCESCQHRNWVDFQALGPNLSCEVCRTDMDMPVGIPWQFRPNEFLVESLRGHSVLSLVWALSALRERAERAFVYLGPTCFGYSTNYDCADSEADLLAIVDDEAIFCEVKSAWRSVRAVHIDSFVKLAKRLRPDRAVFAVMEEGRRFVEELSCANADLTASGIRFELLTPSNYRVDDDPYLAA